MHFATTLLNLAWAIIGLIAFALATRAALGVRRMRILSVALVVSSLFPYISATDDIVRIEHYRSEQTAGSPTSAGDTLLVHLYEALDTLVSHTPPSVCLSLFFFAVIVITVCSPVSRKLASASGRSPPCIAAI